MSLIIIKQISFELAGQPGSKQRPRTGKHGNTYTPRKTVEAEEQVGYAYRRAHRGWMGPSPNPFRVTLGFKVSRQSLDLDNMIKLVLDALNDIAYLDDSQVVKIVAEKFLVDKGKESTYVLLQEGIPE